MLTTIGLISLFVIVSDNLGQDETAMGNGQWAMGNGRAIGLRQSGNERVSGASYFFLRRKKRFEGLVVGERGRVYSIVAVLREGVVITSVQPPGESVLFCSRTKVVAGRVHEMRGTSPIDVIFNAGAGVVSSRQIA